MFSKIYWLYEYGKNAKLGIMARPRGNDWLEEEIISLQKQGVHALVSLLEKDEIQELGLENEEALCLKHQLRFISIPIKDRSIPYSKSTLNTFFEKINEYLKTERSIVIHCRMGIGRSSIIAGAVMIKNGFNRNNIIPHISKIRGIQVPDTIQQKEWLMNI